MSKPSRTTAAKLERLEAERDRAVVNARAGPIRPACERHGWTPEGGLRSNNFSAVASLCPGCREERKKAEREAAAPEVRYIDFSSLPEGSTAAKAWAAAKEAQAKAGIAVAGSTVERELLRAIDDDRADELYELRRTPADRHQANRDYRRSKLGDSRRRHAQEYVPHPARAGS